MPVTKSLSRDCVKPINFSPQSVGTTFTPATRHIRTVDRTATNQARARDGVCLYGLLHKDGCNGPLDGHHINEVGNGGDDVVENIITLCRFKHHRMAQEYEIEREELFAILALYHGYKYEGIQPWTKAQYLRPNLEAPKLWIHRNQSS